MQDRSDFQSMIVENLARVKNVILVGGGKGGVGKSTISANLAYALSTRDYEVGLLDADITGPNITRFFGISEQKPEVYYDKIYPLEAYNVKIISMESLLHFFSEPVAWRGPRVMKAIINFLRDVVWGPLDYLVVDLPPGTGDEILTLLQVVPDIKGALVVTTPQELALMDTAKTVELLRKMDVDIIGVVENMSYFVCDECNTAHELFPRGGLEKFLKERNLRLIARVPIEKQISRMVEEGVPFVTADGKASEEMWKIVDEVEKYVQNSV